MARFMFNAGTTANNNNSGNGNGGDQSWRADAFLNAWLTLPNGKKFKLGAFAYKLSRKADAQLIQMLQQPGAVENLLQFVSFDFQMADAEPEGQENMFAFLSQPSAGSKNLDF